MRILLIFVLIALILSPGPAFAQETFTDADGVSYRVERLMAANYPVALAFTPDGGLYYTEKTTGSLRYIAPDGSRQPEPVVTVPVNALAEQGLLGVAVDPAYAQNGQVWMMRTAPGTARDFPANQVLRFRVEDGLAVTEPEVMLSVPIPNGALIHNGGNLHFDADGLLYVTLGDLEDAANSQDIDTLPGGIHRFAVTDEGLVPSEDNPFSDEEIARSLWAYGLRNSFDFAFDVEPGRIIATENGLHCDDEINLILPGFNYGAGPGYECEGTAQGVDLVRYLPPLLRFTPTQAPTGIVVYSHEAVPEWEGRVFFCVWNDGYPSLRKLTLDDERRTAVTALVEMPLGAGRCRIDLAVDPRDGSLVFSTVGQDGGALWRLSPLTAE